jgi:hypothetical protein
MKYGLKKSKIKKSYIFIIGPGRLTVYKFVDFRLHRTFEGFASLGLNLDRQWVCLVPRKLAHINL